MQTVRVALLPSQFGFPLNILFSMSRTFNIMLNKSGESEHSCLVPDLRGNAFNFSSLNMMLAVGLPYISFITLMYIPSIPTFWRVLITNLDSKFCQKRFLGL